MAVDRTSDADERALAERFRRGDEDAFAEIVRQHRRPVYLMARRLLETHEDADEAAQLAFLRAWKARRGFRGDASLRTWLIRIALNVAKSMRSGTVTHDRLDDAAERIPDRGEGSHERLRRQELRARVREAVGALPPRQREVVLLKVFSELTYRETADMMGLSEGAVKAHLHQAVSNLRRNMAGAREEEWS